MKILMVDKYHFVKGGAERYAFELTEALEGRGHTVIPFSMHHPANAATPYSKYFVDRIDFEAGRRVQKLAVGLKASGRIFYSVQARERLRRLLRDTRPDVAHLHMIDHQISPSILPLLQAAGIPVVQTVHTFKHVCPAYRLYHMGKGRICEKCLDGSYWRALPERCHKNSFWATLMVVLEMTFHKALRFHERGIDLFLPPSRFMASMLARGGVPTERIRHLFYTLNVDRYKPDYGSDPYFLFYGRLSGEKGLMTLLKAAARGTAIPLAIAGDGPQRPALEAFARANGLRNVRFLGNLGGEALRRTVSRSRFTVVPSEWYENSPLVIYESLALGKPVIGAAIGGIPELIDEGRDGLLFPPGDDAALHDRIHRLAGRPGALPRMGRAGRAKAERLFAPGAHVAELTGIYRQLMETRARRARRWRNAWW